MNFFDIDPFILALFRSKPRAPASADLTGDGAVTWVQPRAAPDRAAGQRAPPAPAADRALAKSTGWSSLRSSLFELRPSAYPHHFSIGAPIRFPYSVQLPS